MTSIQPLNSFDSRYKTNEQPANLDTNSGGGKPISTSSDLAFDVKPYDTAIPGLSGEPSTEMNQSSMSNPILSMITQLLQLLIQMLGLSQESPASEPSSEGSEAPMSSASSGDAPKASPAPGPQSPAGGAPSGDAPKASSAPVTSEAPSDVEAPADAEATSDVDAPSDVEATSDVGETPDITDATPEDIALANQIVADSVGDVISNFDDLDADADGIVGPTDFESVLGDYSADPSLHAVAQEALTNGMQPMSKLELSLMHQSLSLESGSNPAPSTDEAILLGLNEIFSALGGDELTESAA